MNADPILDANDGQISASAAYANVNASTSLAASLAAAPRTRRRDKAYCRLHLHEWIEGERSFHCAHCAAVINVSLIG